MKRQYPPLGTVSEGTMRPEDLIPTFMDVFREYAPGLVRDLELEEPIYDDSAEEYIDPEAASEFVDRLFDALRSIAAPYTYFGASKGDGADYGFWPSLESLEEDARYHDGVIKVNDGDEWEYVDDGRIVVNGGRCGLAPIDYVMSVSDHGNVTLYDAHTRKEIWGVV